LIKRESKQRENNLAPSFYGLDLNYHFSDTIIPRHQTTASGNFSYSLIKIESKQRENNLAPSFLWFRFKLSFLGYDYSPTPNNGVGVLNFQLFIISPGKSSGILLYKNKKGRFLRL